MDRVYYILLKFVDRYKAKNYSSKTDKGFASTILEFVFVPWMIFGGIYFITRIEYLLGYELNILYFLGLMIAYLAVIELRYNSDRRVEIVKSKFENKPEYGTNTAFIIVGLFFLLSLIALPFVLIYMFKK